MFDQEEFRESTETPRVLSVCFVWDVFRRGAMVWSHKSTVAVIVPLVPATAEMLEYKLHKLLNLRAGHTVFAARRYREPFCPALPLVLLHGLADPGVESIMLSVLVPT